MTTSRWMPAAVPTAILVAILATACPGAGGNGPDDPGVPDATGDAPPDPGPDDATDVGIAGSDDLPATVPCSVLFGKPNDKTGLTAAQCRPSCDCEGRRFTPPTYGEDDIRRLEARVLVPPMEVPAEDPYAHPELHVPQPGAVCGFLADGSVAGGYRLQTYEGPDAAEAAGAIVTHYDACGLCSPLADLAVYMRHPDLTAPVRQCGIDGMFGGEEVHLQCLLDLGFDEPCARIWYWNTLHTQGACQQVCMDLLDAPYHRPDGSLNACLLCDEVESGDVFKAVAGRNRRNTGLPSSMCRPCSEVRAIVHEYP